MIDGVKIKCIGTTSTDWLNNELLIFSSKVDTSTGEILAKNKVAFYRGLSFHIIPSTIAETEHLIIRGSLAKFYNNGVNNAFDYDFTMLCETLRELEQCFNINLKTALIQSFEFGANIETEQNTNAIIKGLRAYQSYNFTGLKIDNIFNGVQLKKQDTSIKIYDKAKQIKDVTSNLLRLEYVFNFNKVTTKYGFDVLADFLNIDKLNSLKPLLLDVWTNAIFYDKGMKWKQMTQKQKEKMLYYLDATNWVKFTTSQRQKAKAKFRELYNEFCISTTQTDITELLNSKLDKLTAVKRYDLQSFSTPETSQIKAVKKIRFTTLDKLVNPIQNEYHNTSETPQPKKVGKSIKKGAKKCCVCGSDISHKKAIAVYCSKHCNNSKQAQKRKFTRNKQIQKERKDLLKLLEQLKKGNLWLNITYKANDCLYTDKLHQSEVNATSKWIRQIVSVKVNTITLQRIRARQFIREIIKAKRTE